MLRYFLNPRTLLYEAVEKPKSHRYLKLITAVAMAVALVYLSFYLYVSVFKLELPKTASLRRKHAVWETKMQILERNLNIYDEVLSGIEQRDDGVYRSIFGLSPIPDEVRNSGLEGVNRYDDLKEAGANADLLQAVERMDALSKRVYLRSRALDEVSNIAANAGDMISCVPGIPPLMPSVGNFRLSSGFGYRTDPVYGGGEFHTGQDFAADYGTPVYATGDGVVEKAEIKFRGYGNEVVIDHGYGYKTRYAHLRTIEAHVGDTIRSGDRVGTVGSTGKSTGPHLHYEVVYMDNRVNPLNYMDVNMPPSEYRAMVDKRKEEKPSPTAPSTMELLRKRNKS